tara:strand:+ start:3920 stop:4321 length:402 start_codon:yes stop_codon:yes gene_type:complete
LIKLFNFAIRLNIKRFINYFYQLKSFDYFATRAPRCSQFFALFGSDVIKLGWLLPAFFLDCRFCPLRTLFAVCGMFLPLNPFGYFKKLFFEALSISYTIHTPSIHHLFSTGYLRLYSMGLLRLIDNKYLIFDK